MIEILPGILEKDFEEIVRKIDLVKNSVDWIHIDVLDNTLIHNDTYNNWESFKQFTSFLNLEAHLMVSDPAKYIEPLVQNGFKRLIAHVEVGNIRDFIHQARMVNIEIELALDGPSELALIEPYLDEVDSVLLMMYKAGVSGQTFQAQNLVKIKKIHNSYPEMPITIDGGVDKQTAALFIENGATRLVSTSFLFWKNPERIGEAIRELKDSV